MTHINRNLITIKCVLFLFFGGLGCLLPFLPLHMTATRLTVEESKTISIIAPCVAILGPAIAGPLADKLSGGYGGTSRSKTGKYLRVMIVVCFILAAIFYWLLMTVPVIVRSPPTTSFMCNPNGGLIFQERCGAEKTCYNWDSEKRGNIFLDSCVFTCENQDESDDLTTIFPDHDAGVSASEYNENDYNEADVFVSPVEPDILNESSTTNLTKLIPHPHLCYENTSGAVLCEVYTMYSKYLKLSIALNSSEANEEGEVCKYSVENRQRFHCHIPAEIQANLTQAFNACHPVVKCNIYNPYGPESLLIESSCGYNNISFWLYLVIRSIADIFPTAAIALLGAAVVIATRETSTGRGDVGRQLAFGALGFAVFAPIVGIYEQPVIGIAVFSILMVLGSLVLLFSSNMPLSPPEWWWHTRCGMLALPMNTIRKYGLETTALIVILFLLGIFWSAIDSYLPWRITTLSGSHLLIGLTITAGALPSVPFLFFAEKIVDYCGHSNLLITAFTFYIIRYTGLSFIQCPWWLLVCEILEIFTLHLMWITAVLYLRHLIPRKFTVSGQALPVIAHFCLGRFVGALIGGMAYSGSNNTFVIVHRWFAAAAGIIAIIYFLVYHFYLKPRCAAPITGLSRPAPALVQNMNGNGSYTPLRVYHYGKAKKGQFRY